LILTAEKGSLMANTRIRKVSEDDRPALLCIIDGTENLSAEERDCAVELLDIYLSNPLQKDYYFIAATDGANRPLGYVCYGKTPLTDAVYDLYWILVHPDKRRSGIGRMLLEHTEEILEKDGARVLVAETSGLKTYEAARGFYLRNGFIEEARIREFYKPGDDLVVYVKRIKSA
jgi:ribosomal protein S18 acetylase RimI-like enzyme